MRGRTDRGLGIMYEARGIKVLGEILKLRSINQMITRRNNIANIAEVVYHLADKQFP